MSAERSRTLPKSLFVARGGTSACTRVQRVERPRRRDRGRFEPSRAGESHGCDRRVEGTAGRAGDERSGGRRADRPDGVAVGAAAEEGAGATARAEEAVVVPPPLTKAPSLPPPLRSSSLPPPLTKAKAPSLPPPLTRSPSEPPPLKRGHVLPPPQSGIYTKSEPTEPVVIPPNPVPVIEPVVDADAETLGFVEEEDDARTAKAEQPRFDWSRHVSNDRVDLEAVLHRVSLSSAPPPPGLAANAVPPPPPARFAPLGGTFDLLTPRPSAPPPATLSWPVLAGFRAPARVGRRRGLAVRAVLPFLEPFRGTHGILGVGAARARGRARARRADRGRRAGPVSLGATGRARARPRPSRPPSFRRLPCRRRSPRTSPHPARTSLPMPRVSRRSPPPRHPWPRPRRARKRRPSRSPPLRIAEEATAAAPAAAVETGTATSSAEAPAAEPAAPAAEPAARSGPRRRPPARRGRRLDRGRGDHFARRRRARRARLPPCPTVAPGCARRDAYGALARPRLFGVDGPCDPPRDVRKRRRGDLGRPDRRARWDGRGSVHGRSRSKRPRLAVFAPLVLDRLPVHEVTAEALPKRLRSPMTCAP